MAKNKLLIPEGRFGAERSAGFIQSALQVRAVIMIDVENVRLNNILPALAGPRRDG